MAEQFNRDELQRQTAAPADASDEEEGVRRLMRQLLNTPPQPRKAAKGRTRGGRGIGQAPGTVSGRRPAPGLKM